jgi:hypothetical protein
VAPGTYDLLTSQQTSTVSVGIVGPQGPPGATGPTGAGVTGATGAVGATGANAPVMTVRIDTSTAGVIYVGKALDGTAESSANWEINKSTFNSAGLRLTTGAATNVSWAGRTGHTYT